MKYLVCLILILGCAKQKADEEATQKTSAAAIWTGDFPAWTIDLSRANKVRANFAIFEYYPTGGRCQSTAKLDWVGTYDTGNLIISGSTDLFLNPGEPDCSQFDGTWTYSYDPSKTLTICTTFYPQNVCVDMY